jgi:hypothetical protein
MDKDRAAIGGKRGGYRARGHRDGARQHGDRLGRGQFQRDGDPLGFDGRLALEQDDHGDLNIGHDDVPQHDHEILGDLQRPGQLGSVGPVGGVSIGMITPKIVPGSGCQG